MSYGKELVLDMYGCNSRTFNRDSVENWLKGLCELIDMEREALYFWDYEGVPESEIPYDEPHLVGTSAVQFITTSNVVIHSVDMFRECYVNLFSCKDFDVKSAVDFTVSWFKATRQSHTVVVRGKDSKHDC